MQKTFRFCRRIIYAFSVYNYPYRTLSILWVSICLMMFFLFIIGCGKKETTAPTQILGVYSKDSLAVRHILDANGLSSVVVGGTVSRRDQINQDRIGELNVQKMGITVIPPEIGQLTGLHTLYLDSNAITALPAEIGNCVALTVITASNNNLTALPAAIGKLTALKILSLSHNSIASLPSELGAAQALTTLKLDFNSLSTLPSSIGALKLMQVAYLNNNGLTALPSEITQCTLLKGGILTVAYNKLCSLPEIITLWMTNNTELNWQSTQQCP